MSDEQEATSCNADIYEAIVKNDMDRLRSLLKNPILTFDQVFGGAMTCLHRAVKTANKEAIELLIDHGADINICTEGTPLHLAVIMGRLDLVELLVKLGADVNSKDNKGFSPLYMAVVCKYKEIVKHLLENNAMVDCRNPFLMIDRYSKQYEI